MARLILLDNEGGSLATLGTGMARLEGAQGFDSVVARTTGQRQIHVGVPQILEEVGLRMIPGVRSFEGKEQDDDEIIALSKPGVPEAVATWGYELPNAEFSERVYLANLRVIRDQIAKQIAHFCASRS
jgi:hypothetical protein